MEKTRNFLLQNKESFELFANFEDHKVYYYAIEQKVTADNCIETCKSLIEGISKTILEQIDLRDSHIRDRFSEQDAHSLETTFRKMNGRGEDSPVLFRQESLVLSNYHNACHRDLLDTLGKNLCKYLARLRNERGDISHGRAAPKQIKSSLDLAYMIESLTDLITFHMLEIFSLIDFKTAIDDEEFSWIEEAFAIKPDSDLSNLDVKEQFVRQFNTQLDIENPIGDGLRFSEALYYQKQEEYLILLRDYELDQNMESL
ncbi:MAG: hypothetical protein ACRBEE_15620 [Arenicella sp.]